MSDEPGHTSGQPPAGLSWGDLVGALVEQHGTLTAVAWKLIEHASGDDVASIERALRRLRSRGQLDGGVWGARLLRVFGVPASVESRLRWMGHYHSPFNDLPLTLCLDQVRLWDRPPVSSSRARVWLHLGHASCALRRQLIDEAAQHARHASSALAGLSDAYDAARIEVSLIDAYVASRVSGDVNAALDEADRLLRASKLGEADRACFAARLVDQRAYQLNRRGELARALAMYEALPVGAHPFADYRRAAGCAYGYYKAGRREEALRAAQLACEVAGDGGYTRLRAMGLLLLAKILGEDGAATRERARQIAERLDDAELLARATRS